MQFRQLACVAVAALLVAGLRAAPVAAQAFPGKPITIIVPFPAGSASDSGARIMAQAMSESLKVPVVVDNKPGASGIVGTEFVKRAVGDPYTLIFAASTTHAANVSLFKTLPYDPVKDFTPIAKVGVIGWMLMVRPDFPGTTIKDVVAYGKANPDKLTFGHGTAGMLAAGSLFAKSAGFTARPIPYKGNPPAMADLLGGTIDFSFVDMGNAVPQLKAGKLKGLGVTLASRSAHAPDVPTFGEAGYPNVVVVAWVGLLAPANIPKEAQQKLIAAAAAALTQPEVKAKLLSAGFDLETGDGEVLARTIDADIKHWARMLSDAGVKPE
jgi:tripartite-type tricarboxylate transporter receptor subunit TctC